MGSLIFNNPMLAHTMINRTSLGKFGEVIKGQNLLHFRFRRLPFRILKQSRIYYDPAPPSNGREDQDPQNFLEELRVPKHWLDPAKASEESEWLRVTLNKWLDDEYCPEETNIEISKGGCVFFQQIAAGKTRRSGGDSVENGCRTGINILPRELSWSFLVSKWRRESDHSTDITNLRMWVFLC